jgi:hypothetical protein
MSRRWQDVKTGLDDYLVHCGTDAFQALVNRTPYDKSLLELQGLSLTILNFSDKYGFSFQGNDKKITFIKPRFQLVMEGSQDPRLTSLYVDESLIAREKLNLALGTKKDSFVKRCHLDEKETKEVRRFLDIAFEFISLQSEVDRKESQIRRELKEKFPLILSISERKRDRALELGKRPDLLYRVRRVLEEKLGLVGEELNGLLMYLALTSRLLQKPISVVVKGSSSAGKSFLVKIALILFPKEVYIELTGLSPKALVYLSESFSHRFLIIYEVHGVKEEDYTEYMIRTLLSENRIRYAVVERNDFEGHETRIIEREGPTGLITTTTHPSIHDENETRLFSIAISETSDQTDNIKDKIAEKYEEIQAEVSGEEIEDLINLQRLLEPLHVRIPYTKALAKLIPNEPIRMRRDFQRILAVIEVIALLHQHQREVKELNGIRYIEAKLEDYYIARRLLEGPLNLTLLNKYPQTVELVKAVMEIHKEKSDPVTVKQLQERLKKPKMTVTRWLRPALEHGWVENIGEEGRGKPLKLVPGKFEESGASLLPSIEILLEKFPNDAQQFKVIDPITGGELGAEEE